MQASITSPLSENDYAIIMKHADSARLRIILKATYPNHDDFVKVRASIHNMKRTSRRMRHTKSVKAHLEKLAAILRAEVKNSDKTLPVPNITKPIVNTTIRKSNEESVKKASEEAKKAVINSNKTLIESLSSEQLASLLQAKGVHLYELVA